jgi:hypothetical protein
MSYMRLVVSFLWFIFTSCDFAETSSPEVSYINVPSATVQTKQGEGAPTEDIREVWCYVDDAFIGVFPIPAKIPIVSNKANSVVSIAPGVKPNADRFASREYPFYNAIVTSATSKSLDAVFTYQKDLVFDFVDDFESNINVFDTPLTSSSPIVAVNTKSDFLTGASSGLIETTLSHPIAEITTQRYYKNVKSGNIFLELDYKNEVDLYVGAEVETKNSFTSQYKLRLAPSKEWRKAYVDLADLVSKPSVNAYRVLLAVNKSSQIGKVYIDNVKLIHF